MSARKVLFIGGPKHGLSQTILHESSVMFPEPSYIMPPFDGDVDAVSPVRIIEYRIYDFHIDGDVVYLGFLADLSPRSAFNELVRLALRK